MTDAITKLRSVRDGLAGITELLLSLLDELDGDENLEDGDEDKQVDDDRCDVADSGDDEPWLAGQASWGHEVDLEGDPCDQGEPEEGI